MTSNPAGEDARRDRWPFFCNVAIASITAVICWLRMGTWVTGEDPFIYLKLARRLLESGFSREAVAELAAFIAPIYPLWITLVLGVAGPAAVYVLNLVTWILLVALAGRWVAQQMKPNERIFEVWMGAVFALVLLGGYGLNVHFLLLPFRETTALLVVVLALLMWDRAVRASSYGCGLATGLLTILAMGIREPVALALVGPVLFDLWRIFRYRSSARPLLGVVTLPLLVLILLTSLYLIDVWQPNFQIKLWWSSLTAGAAGSRYINRLVETAHWIPGELGWFGIISAVWAFWRQRRHPHIFWSYFFPSLLFLAFHAGYTPHRRYFLMTLFFLIPAVGYGSYDAFGTLAGRFIGRSGRKRAAWALAWSALMAVLLWTAVHVQPWGSRVSRDDVRQMARALSVVSDKQIAVDPRCRRLVDALVTYADMQPVNFADDAFRKTRWSIVPLNDAALYPPDRPLQQVLWPNLLRYYGRADRSDASTLRFPLGQARFQVKGWTPWDHRVIECEVDLKEGWGVLWLDLGAGDDVPSPASVVVQTGEKVLWRGDVSARGWQPIAVRTPEATGATLRVRIEAATGCLPDQPIVAVQRARRFVSFGLTNQRSLSTDRWMEGDGPAAPRPSWRLAAPAHFLRRVRLPIPSGELIGAWSCRLTWLRKGKELERQNLIEIRSPSLAETSRTIWPVGEATLNVELSGAGAFGASGADHDLALDVVVQDPVNVILAEVQLCYDPPDRNAGPEN